MFNITTVKYNILEFPNRHIAVLHIPYLLKIKDKIHDYDIMDNHRLFHIIKLRCDHTMGSTPLFSC
jgi:hypothetical protein